MDLEDVDPVVVEGRIQIPYRWPAGKVAGRFLHERRTTGRLWGQRCGACEIVIVPPRPRCIRCNSAAWEWKEVGPEGTVISWTRTKDGVLALVRPDGADTAILEKLAVGGIRTGMRVKL